MSSPCCPFHRSVSIFAKPSGQFFEAKLCVFGCQNPISIRFIKGEFTFFRISHTENFQYLYYHSFRTVSSPCCPFHRSIPTPLYFKFVDCFVFGFLPRIISIPLFVGPQSPTIWNIRVRRQLNSIHLANHAIDI